MTVTSPSEEPAWKQRAVERSIKTAKLCAAQRVQRFLDAAQAIIIEKGSTDFTVQEVVDRSRQSLRSFYLQFDGKHELLLALFEDALSRSADQIRAATANQSDPLEALKVAIELLFKSSRPGPCSQATAFHGFRPPPAGLAPFRGENRARSTGRAAHRIDGQDPDAPGEFSASPFFNPKRMAAMTMQTVMFFVAQSSGRGLCDRQADFTSRRGMGFLLQRIRRRLARELRSQRGRISLTLSARVRALVRLTRLPGHRVRRPGLQTHPLPPHAISTSNTTVCSADNSSPKFVAGGPHWLCPEKDVKSLHALFPREGRADEPVEYRRDRSSRGQIVRDAVDHRPPRARAPSVTRGGLHARRRGRPASPDRRPRQCAKPLAPASGRP